MGLLAAALVFRRIWGRIFGRNRRHVLELGPRGQTGHFDNAGIANAILHASEIGRPVYERLGFEEVCQTPQWIWMPPEE